MDELITLKEGQMERCMNSLEIAESKIIKLQEEVRQSHNLEEKLKQLDRKYKNDLSKLQNDL